MPASATSPTITAIKKLAERLKQIAPNDKKSAMLLRDDAVSLAKRTLNDPSQLITRLHQIRFSPAVFPHSSADAQGVLLSALDDLDRNLQNFRYEAEHQAAIPLPKPEKVTLSWISENVSIRYLYAVIVIIVTIFYLGRLSTKVDFDAWLKSFLDFFVK
jgi:hypothetical protein